MKKTIYVAPAAEEVLLTVGVICATDLPTDTTDGLEEWETLSEGSWDA